MNNSFQRKPALIKLGISVSTFTHSCMQKSGLSLFETHPVLSGSGTLRSFSDLPTFNDSLCCPACDCHSTSDSLPAEVKTCFMSLTRNVKVSEILRIIHLRKMVSFLHRKHASLPERTTEKQLKRVHMYRRISVPLTQAARAAFHLPLILLRSQYIERPPNIPNGLSIIFISRCAAEASLPSAAILK